MPLLVLMAVLMSKKKIAVIGCGIFGAEIALKLSNFDHEIQIFEKESQCLLGASLNNQNRLHKGFHYPRDLNTAQQCIKGFDRFVSEYPDCIENKFDNLYFISSRDSQTTPDKFIDFCNSLNDFKEIIDIQSLPVSVRNTELAVLTEEAVYDCKILRTIILQKLKNSNVEIFNNIFVDDIAYDSSNNFQLFSNENNLGVFDFVINCTYANINSLTKKLGHKILTNQYEYTFTPIIDLDIEKIGITIMDGPFTTLLPYGKSNKYLLYHVDHSVIARKNSKEIDPSWLMSNGSPMSGLDVNYQYNKIINAASEFMPFLDEALLSGYLSGPRMVKAKVDSTDERPSNISYYENGYCTVFSGKIDHCVWVADEILNWVNK